MVGGFFTVMNKWVSAKCEWCGKDFDANYYSIQKGEGKFCSRNCSCAYGNKLRSDGNSRSNTRKVAREIYMKRYGLPTCQHCGSIPADVHHLDENVKNNELDNLLPLCRSCHVKYHNHVSPKRRKTKGRVDLNQSPYSQGVEY